MMLDADVVVVSPSSVYSVLKEAGRLGKEIPRASSTGRGVVQPSVPHEHWHIDVSCLNICGTFYYLRSVLDGYSRYIVHWEIRESMTEADAGTILPRAHEPLPEARPRIISENGPQFVARDFKTFVRLYGMTPVRTSSFYPPKQRQDRELAQDAQPGMHSSGNTAQPGRGATHCCSLCPTLHRCTSARWNWLPHTQRSPG